MEPKVLYPKTVREDTICNICQRTVSRLSWDHVPPQGSHIPVNVTTIHYPEGEAGSIFRHATSANGLKFRTLCKDCNSMLGSKYDKELNLFLNQIQDILKTRLVLPSRITLQAKPTLIIKAILGHILATKTGFCDSDIDKAFRDYITNDSAVLSDKIKVYYWYYPYNNVIITTDKMPYDIESGQKAFFSVLKYYPLAFMTMWESSSNVEGMVEITKYNKNDYNHTVALPISFVELPADFPESTKYCHIALVPSDHTDLMSFPHKTT